MDLILLQKVKNLGDLGDIVKVRAGYGRNYLLPRGIALPATEANRAVFEARKAELVQRSEESLNAARLRAEQLADKVVTVRVLAGEEGRLYGSVGPAEIAHAAGEQGIDVRKREIDMPGGPIRVIGSHTVAVHLHTEVEVALQVEVERDK